MASRIATLRLQLIDSASGPAKKTSEAMKGLEASISKLGKNGVAGAKNLGNQLDYLRRKAAAVGEFSQLRRGLAQTYGSFREARTHAKRLEEALASVTKPTAKMNAEMRTARSALKAATTAFNEQRAAVKSAENSLKSYSITSRTNLASSQRRIRDEMSQTIRKMRDMERESRKPKPQPDGGGGGGGSRGGGGVSAGGAMVGAAGGYVAHRAGGIARNAFMDTVSYDQAKAYRDALGYDVFDKNSSKLMNEQAEKIGYETRFTNADVVRAQVGLLQGGIRDAEAIRNAIQPITDYALAMGVTMEESTETIRSASQIRKIPLTDVKSINEFVDSLVWMAKNGGMDDSDVKQYIRYGGSAMQSAGLNNPTANALGVILRRAGYRGDEAGVFTRTAAAKLTAPTNPGRTALHAMGINFDDYVTQPDAFKVNGIASMIKENYGVRIDKDMQAKITDFLDNATYYDPEEDEEMSVRGDRGEFTAGLMKLLDPILGEMSAKDKKAVASDLGDFHKFSAESVNTQALLAAIMESNPTAPQMNAIFTQRQGSRAMVIADRYNEFLQVLELMNKIPDGITHKIGVDANKGLYGDFTRATGAVETALIRMVEDWGGPISSALKAVDYLASEFTQLSESTRKVIEVMGALAIAAGGYAAMRATRGILGRVLGGGGGKAASAASKGRGGAVAAGGGRGGRGAGLGRGGGASLGLGAIGAVMAINEMPTDREELQAFMDANAKRSEGWNDWLERNIGTPRSWLGIKGSASTSASDKSKAGLENEILSSTSQWPIAAQQGIRAYIGELMTGGAEAEAKATATGEQIKQALTIDGKLSIDTSQLEHALGLARQLASVARGGAVVSPSGGSLDPKLDGRRAGGGPVKAGGLYQINEKGQELFAPGANGTIIPNHRINGGGEGGTVVKLDIHQTFHVNGDGGDMAAKLAAATKAAVQQVSSEIEAKLSRSLQTAFGNVSYGDA